MDACAASAVVCTAHNVRTLQHSNSYRRPQTCPLAYASRASPASCSFTSRSTASNAAAVSAEASSSLAGGVSRRGITSLGLVGALLVVTPGRARAETLAELYDQAQALGQREEYAAADAVWTRAIQIDPKNSATWSNRGTARLQACRWADVRRPALQFRPVHFHNASSMCDTSLILCAGAKRSQRGGQT